MIAPLPPVPRRHPDSEADWERARSERAERDALDEQEFLDAYVAEYDPDRHGPDPATETNGHHAPASRELTALRAAHLRGRAIKDLEPPAALVDEVADLDSLAVTFGPTGIGKSSLAVSLGCAVSTGIPWFGHEVHQGPVLYVLGEGAAGLGLRLAAWESYWRTDVPETLHWITRPANLLEPAWVDALVVLAVEVEPVLVVVDTLARAMVGGNENDSRDMTRAVDSLDRVRRATGACTMVVHHTGKDESAGSRGHSSLKAALDTELALRARGKRIELYVEKQRNHRAGYVAERLKLVEHEGSVVLDEYHAELDDQDDAELTESDLTALEALRSIQVDEGVSFTLWRDAAVELGISKATFARARQHLVARELVRDQKAGGHSRYVTSETT